jgi:threonylcarbamoyladenosine tRNA methylthiotransferase MtaB
MAKFSVWTFGCRCNQADSAAIRESLCRRSMSESESCRDADLIVINTCTVTHRADQQARQTIRRLHRENPSARVIVTGCYAERDPDTLASLPGVGLVIGNADKDRLPELIENYGPLEKCGQPSQNKIIHAPIDAGCDYFLPPMTHTGGKTRPLVKLQDGCDARCSYCIVPKVRGPGRSARPEDILAEVQSLVGHGFQEIVLTGIHLGAYGRRLKLHARLIDLLRRIVEIPGLGRIRLSSIEPMLFDRAIIRLAVENPAIAHHFHIPLQSGSARILRRMRRPYTADRFRELLRSIHSELPDAGLGADVLVGFPGETEQDFEETCALIEDLPLSYLHVFPFSPREGTDAWSLPDPVPAQIVKHRLAKALELSRSKNLVFRKKFLGKVLPAITLAKEENLGASIVLTGNYIQALVPGLSVAPNRLVEIRIDDVRPEVTYASMVSEMS